MKEVFSGEFTPVTLTDTVKQQVGVCGVSRCREMMDSSGFNHENIEYL